MQTLATQVIEIATQKDVKIAVAESCTGGWIGQALTSVSGSSRVFEGGFITYSNAAKMQALGVPKSVLQTHGAVSEPVAQAMADQARQKMQAGIAIAVTGIAGPGGGSPHKPVGTVCFGLSQAGHDIQSETELFDDKGRQYIREVTVMHALHLMQKALST